MTISSTDTVTITDPLSSLTINTGYNAAGTEEYVHFGEKPDGIVSPIGILNNSSTAGVDVTINTGSLNKNQDGEDSVTIYGDLTLPGHQLDITANNITIEDHVTVSTSNSSGEAGAINLNGFHITLGTEAKLFADGSDISTSGDIIIKAMDPWWTSMCPTSM